MKNFIKIFNFIFCIITFTFSSGHLPHLIIFENDTLPMYSSPSQFFRERTIPWKYRKYGGDNTRCSRGYQALWEIKNDSLFLREVFGCNRKTYISINQSCLDSLKGKGLTEKSFNALTKIKDIEFAGYYVFLDTLKSYLSKSDYKKFSNIIYSNSIIRRTDEKYIYDKNLIIKNKYIVNGFFASDVSEPLHLQIAPLIKYVNCGWDSVYDKEIIIEINNGTVENKIEVETLFHQLTDDSFNMHFCEKQIDFWLPSYFVNCYNSNKIDSIIHSNDYFSQYKRNIRPFSAFDTSGTIFIRGISWYDRNTKYRFEKISYIRKVVQNEKKYFLDKFSFSKPNYARIYNPTEEFMLYMPYLFWVSGKGKNNSTKLKIVALSNSNTRAVFILYSTDLSKAEFDDFFIKLVQGMNLSKYKVR